MKNNPLSIPLEFSLSAAGGRWFKYYSEQRNEEDIFHGFWETEERRVSDLHEISRLPGIYCIAWGKPKEKEPTPKANEIQYIGQTVEFRRRLREFAYSAGIYWDVDERCSGHSAGWRWGYEESKIKGPYGKKGYEEMYVAFFPVPGLDDLPAHLWEGLLCMHEAQAIHAYFQENGKTTPPINTKNRAYAKAEPD